jgi:hypothetical protein
MKNFAELMQILEIQSRGSERARFRLNFFCSQPRPFKPQFKDLLFRRGQPCFFAFDLLMLDGKEMRRERLIDRRLELRRLLRSAPSESLLRYVDHVNGSGMALFERVCDLDLEGIVAKQKSAPYVDSREETTGSKF